MYRNVQNGMIYSSFLDICLEIFEWHVHTLNNMLDIYLATSNTTAKPFNEFIIYGHWLNGIILYGTSSNNNTLSTRTRPLHCVIGKSYRFAIYNVNIGYIKANIVIIYLKLRALLSCLRLWQTIPLISWSSVVVSGRLMIQFCLLLLKSKVVRYKILL